MPPDAHGLAKRCLEVVENDIVPLTRRGVAAGNKIFGAAILRKDDRSLVVAGTNAETENPLFHGEVSALNAFYKLPAASRPATRDCLFIATHEPCPLCLSAITWAGFDNFVYLFGYEETRDAFNIPHDLRILKEVFRIDDGAYAHSNAFWTCRSVAELVDGEPREQQAALLERIAEVEAIYADLSETYQASKAGSAIPLS